MEPRYSDRLWLATIIAGVVFIVAAIALIIWFLTHPVPVWPEFDIKEAQDSHELLALPRATVPLEGPLVLTPGGVPDPR
jgi:hypothetical protein